MTALTGRSIDEVYAFDGGKRLWGWDGTSWTMIQTLPAMVTSASMIGDVGMALGADGLVVHGRVGGARSRW